MNKILTFAAVLFASLSLQAREVYVDRFDLSSCPCGQGLSIRAGKPVDGECITIDGKTYAHGFGARPESAVAFLLNGKVQAFDAVVGIDDASVRKGEKDANAYFRVWADGEVVWNSGLMKPADGARSCHVALEGVRMVVLETASGGQWADLDKINGDWADARFDLGRSGKARLADSPDLFTQLGILTPAPGPEPRFNGADIWGVRPGHPVIFRVPVSGLRPMSFEAEGLPEGVTFDTSGGIIGGVAPSAKGSYNIRVRARNSSGVAERDILLKVTDTLALTPPMGWNSWNIWGRLLTDEKVRQSADALLASGLCDYGWAYVNLDDFWQMNNTDTVAIRKRALELGREDLMGPSRDSLGRILPNRSFPDMKALADYIHSFGFKAGLYSSPGPLTCGKCEGSYGHELQDAASWAEWGFDYVKYDRCTYNKIMWAKAAAPGGDLRTENIRPYALMYECLKQQDRDIVYSYCQYGDAGVEEWGREYGANCFRTWSDLKDCWSRLELAIDSKVNAEYWKYTGPGFWADPDMLTVGDQNSYGHRHPTMLTPNEQYTHLSIWAMISAPLFIGCDLTRLDDFTRSLLTNSEVIAISQDRLGAVARRCRHTDGESVWVRPLANGDYAVALLNRSPVTRTVRAALSELGLEGAFLVRDCWRGQDEGSVEIALEASIPPHATKLVRLHPVICPRCL